MVSSPFPFKKVNLKSLIKGASYIKEHQNKSKFDTTNITTIKNTIISTKEQMVRISATEKEIHVLWNEYEDLLGKKKSTLKKNINMMRDICGHLEQASIKNENRLKKFVGLISRKMHEY